MSLIVGSSSIAAWWVVIPVARRWAGWVDRDQDGFLDGFANGPFGSFDIYGGHWGALVVGVSTVCLVVLMALRRQVRATPR